MQKPIHAAERDRQRIPEKYKWKLEDLYADVAAWRAEKSALAARIPSLQQYQGKLPASAKTLADALDCLFTLDKELWRFCEYAALLADQDAREAEPQGMRQETLQLRANFESEAA